MKKTTILSLAIIACSSKAAAVDIYSGDEVSATLNGTVEASAGYRINDYDKSPANQSDPNINSDDGTGLYDKGWFSKEMKITADLLIQAEDTGALIRGSAWYDYEIMNKNPDNEDFDKRNHTGNGHYPSSLQNEVGKRAELLDAYIFHNMEISGVPASFRLGRQVVSWGESIYYGDSLNVVNPYNVSKLATPNAKFKEALLPVNMAYAQFGLTETLSVEGFTALEWKGNQAIPNGSFYSDEDIFGPGSNGAIIDLRPDLALMGIPEFLVPGVNGVDGVVSGIRRGRNDEGSDNGQFGLALRYLSEELNDTEVSLFYINYNSRNPFLRANGGQSAACSVGGGSKFSTLCALAAAPEDFALVDGLEYLDTTTYDLIYPENIHLYGLTVSGNVGDTNIAGEITYRPNAAIESSMSGELEDLAIGALSGGASGGSINLGSFGDITQNGSIELYRRNEFYTMSASVLHNVGPTYGLDDLTIVYELFGNYIPGGLVDDESFNYLTKTAYGHTINLAGKVEDIFPGIDLKPGLTFRQDIRGYSPVVTKNFVEDRKSVTVEFGLDLSETFQTKVSYVNYWGAKELNPMQDRDHLVFNATYNF
ncbi:DUF1302 family protein [Pseudomonas aeruginosa]|uniref:DUF1302 domain-containing protein n=1 Tax=Pseudomonas aeruginosa TaxID=287 RepID=UPI000F82C50C|nr:DUF1302 domain-containing protein [Pseudomonas aeruginosa]RTT13488.1 DUF1302 family protein [Pseudomonas aeruginosa]